MTRVALENWQDKDYQEKHSAVMASPKVRRKISQAALQQWRNPETRATIMAAIEESRDKSIAGAKEYWKDPKNRKRRSEIMGSPEVREKLSLAAQNQWEDEQYREQFSEMMKEHWRSGTFDNRTGPSHVSNLETEVIDEIERTGYTCIRQYRPEGCSFVFDAYIPEINTVIEVDGMFWHHSEWAKEKGQPERDRRKDKWARDHGLDMHRIPESLFEEMTIREYIEGWRNA